MSASWAVQRQREKELRPLFDYMTQRGIKRSWLGERLRMSSQRIYDIRVGRVPAPKGFVEAACDELGISPRYLEPGPTAVRKQRKSA